MFVKNSQKWILLKIYTTFLFWWRNFYARLRRKTNINNLNWYVWIALVSWLFWIWWFIISLYTLFSPIKSIEQKIDELQYNFNEVYNEQFIDTSKLNGGKIIELYFQYINQWDYTNACSLRGTYQCNMYNVNSFTQRVKDQQRVNTIKFKDWEKLLNVWWPKAYLENTMTEVWCVKSTYTINFEVEPVYQFSQYKVANRPDGKKEIRSVICESSFKNGLDRSKAMNCDAQDKICVNSEPN